MLKYSTLILVLVCCVWEREKRCKDCTVGVFEQLNTFWPMPAVGQPVLSCFTTYEQLLQFMFHISLNVSTR